MNDQEKIYALQSALRACLTLIYDAQGLNETERIAAAMQAQQALDDTTPEAQEFPVYCDAQGREHAEF